jgi:hypothetical protein
MHSTEGSLFQRLVVECAATPGDAFLALRSEPRDISCGSWLAAATNADTSCNSSSSAPTACSAGARAGVACGSSCDADTFYVVFSYAYVVCIRYPTHFMSYSVMPMSYALGMRYASAETFSSSVFSLVRGERRMKVCKCKPSHTTSFQRKAPARSTVG